LDNQHGFGQGRYNLDKLERELRQAGILYSSIDSLGRVLSPDGMQWIHERSDVAAIIAAHDPTPDPDPASLEERIEAAELFLSLLLDQEVTQ
jgi:hypothetical protein